MAAPRPFSLIQTADQWRRASFDQAALLDNVVQLAWRTDGAGRDTSQPTLPPEGLAFDGHCRLYFTSRAEGRVRRLLWAAVGVALEPVDVLAHEPDALAGEFQPKEQSELRLDPTAVAIDAGDRLYVASGAARTVAVLDLWSGRLLRTIPVPGTPVDMAARSGGDVLVLLAGPGGLLTLDARTGPRQLPLPAGVTNPGRVAASGRVGVAILDAPGTAVARVLIEGRAPLATAWATDIEFQTEDTLVIARRPGEDFLRVHYSGSAVERIAPLKGKGYDGRGIVLTPDGRIGYLTGKGVRHAVAARLHFAPKGRVTTFRLDSDRFQTTWGRVFIDACIPRETSVRIHCAAADEPPAEVTLVRQPPANGISISVPSPELSPPMPPLSMVPDEAGVTQLLHRRSTGPELPWIQRPAADRFVTYEAPALTTAGRYLWITVELSGNGLFTPFVRSVRAEQVPHEYLTRLPKVYAREDEATGFLRRYLAMFDESLAELDSRSLARHTLIDSRSAPAEFLPWLAGFVGLLTDKRWPEPVKRQLIEEAVWLFRFRGTVPGLKRFLEIYLGRQVILIEKYQTRGLGGALVGSSNALTANSILGAGFRVGGAIAADDEQFIQGNAENAFDLHAHRFTVIIPAVLDEEQLAVVQHILDVHRPAHTLVDVCTVGAGMRAGRGLHVGLTSMIGATGRFRPIQLASSFLGRGAVIGRPEAGTPTTGGSGLGRDTRVG